jgi:hypothetical protein
MHTAICAFDNRARAEQAVDDLVRAGFARHDVHIEHKDLHGERLHGEGRDANDRWDGLEREIAVDPSVVARFGHFFDRLFGRERHPAHVDSYAQHVERGSYVVVVDGRDDAEAQRARTLLHGMQASDVNLVHRPERPPLRDIVGLRQEQGIRGTAGMAERSREPYEGMGATSSNLESERAMATNSVVTPRTGPELRDPDVEHAPGLRYADKDKPLG